MELQKLKNVAIIVAHPDDETLWAGGTMMSNPSWKCYVVCLCRKSDQDRAPRFFKALTVLGATGIMGDLNDGPEQIPLKDNDVQEMIKRLIPDLMYDLVITHNPDGEYTRHLRHEEISRAVINLWAKGLIAAKQLWTFAYEDGHKSHYPKPQVNADFYHILEQRVYDLKYNIITLTYGFEKSSWEAKTTPQNEAFWYFPNPVKAMQWVAKGGAAS
ncbi:GlcNAc-PI de-N-acetylase [Mucilaginibacter gracilis]|uniref:GlcNAc-PI de-N-acetylase n=1 Tax=Mucilaginibacter gracilis TaxID=423350 RepID=A0A495J7M4_9SPHI|nr:PIG-L family deacetylase [Mucilaginibacter gracilis]RKR84743.1 GlcNAc-PI de-N-acetylase [Mucilaginibacter gracilis]